MLAKQLAKLFGSEDPERIVAADRLIQSVFQSEEFRKEAIFKIAFGQMPPHSEEIEAAFLGCALLNPQRAVPNNLSIEEDYFYLDKFRLIWRAILRLHHRTALITPVAIADELSADTFQGMNAGELVGGQYGVEELMFGHTSWEEAEGYGERLKQYYLQRQSMSLCMDAAVSLLKAPPEAALDIRGGVVSALTNLGSKFVQGVTSGHELSEQVMEHLRTMKSWADLGIAPKWAMSPVRELNLITGGWKPSDLIILAARPGMGKTAYVMSEMDFALNLGEPVGMFSLEMSSLQLGLRLLVMNSTIPNEALRTGKITNYEIQMAEQYVSRLKSMGLYLDDTPGISIDKFEQKATMMVEKYGVRRIYVDYIQLMDGPGGNREAVVAGITRRLKATAKRLNIPVIALSQLSRAVETRGGSKRPQLSDLRESGGIEQDGDIVGFIYRPQYYGIMEDEHGQKIDWAEIIIAKHRNGPTDTAKAKFLESQMKWCSFTNDYSIPSPSSSAGIDDLMF